MAIYTGTLTGSGQISGSGISLTETQTDDVTLDITISADGSFTGTEEQVITTTVDAGQGPTTTTDDTGPQQVSGNVHTQNVVTNNSSGNNATVTETFSSDLSQVTVVGTDVVNVAGLSGTINYNGVLTSSDAPSVINPSEVASVTPPSMNLQDVKNILSLSDAQLALIDAQGLAGSALAITGEEKAINLFTTALSAEDLAETTSGAVAKFGNGISTVAATVGFVNGVVVLGNGINAGSNAQVADGAAGIVENGAGLISSFTGTPGLGALGEAMGIGMQLGTAIQSGNTVQILTYLEEAAIVGGCTYLGCELGLTGADYGAALGQQFFNYLQANQVSVEGAVQGFQSFLDSHPQLSSAYDTGGFSGLFNEVTDELWSSASPDLTSEVNVDDSSVGGARAASLASSTAITVTVSNPLEKMIATMDIVGAYLLGPHAVYATRVQIDHFAITQTALPTDQATTIANAINAGTQTETQYVNDLLSQVVNTTIPAVAVEATMYGVTGTSGEITNLAANFLPAQVANAINHGLNPQVYACEVVGLAFAFGNETGSTGFANNFGPSNTTMPNTAAGDAAFAAAACNTIFGAASTANLVSVLQTFVSNWEAFYTSAGIPGNATPTTAQIDLAARGAAWGDMVGVALANNLGPLSAQVTNFLEDAAQGSAVYGASLVGQPAHQPFA